MANSEKSSDSDIGAMMDALGQNARRASIQLARSATSVRNTALRAAGVALQRDAAAILAANARDMRHATKLELGSAMLDRLMLNPERIEAMAATLLAIAERPDPLGQVTAAWERPNGLTIQRVSVPLGVIGIIYESRPNVTADAAALCLKAGNAVILRGGSESQHSNRAIHSCIQAGLVAAGIDALAVQLVPTTDRAAVGYLLSSMGQWIDVLVPRGGKSLVQRVQEEARVPVISHLEGICHVYLHSDADTDMACAVAVNAKMRRTGICGAAETVLVDRAAASRLLPRLIGALQKAGCEIRGDLDVQAISPGVLPASDDDWRTEYLDAIVSVRVVDDINAAIEHIGDYGSAHTDSIVTDNKVAAEKFLREVDSAIVLHNASTQFADGGEFGMGAEIGIATGRIHARGPVGAEQLTSYKYVVRGSGQLRP